MTLELRNDDAPAEVRIVRCGYDAKCKAKKCGPGASAIARYLDSMGRFLRQFELCGAHADRLAVRDTARGVAVIDQRND
jgi:hypothetical protein